MLAPRPFLILWTAGTFTVPAVSGLAAMFAKHMARSHRSRALASRSGLGVGNTLSRADQAEAGAPRAHPVGHRRPSNVGSPGADARPSQEPLPPCAVDSPSPFVTGHRSRFTPRCSVRDESRPHTLPNNSDVGVAALLAPLVARCEEVPRCLCRPRGLVSERSVRYR